MKESLKTLKKAERLSCREFAKVVELSNTHKYKNGIRYIHFFKNKESMFLLREFQKGVIEKRM